MAKKNLGYVELEWTCPSCGSKNPGTVALCTSCAAPQPADVQFEQPAQEILLNETDQLNITVHAPDIHCAFCGARNSAKNQVCTRCGADLSQGEARQQGQIIGAHRPDAAPDITCPACGSTNPATAHRCSQCGANLGATEPSLTPTPQVSNTKPRSNMLLYVLIGFALFACAALALLFLRTEEVIGRVEATKWTRTIAIEELGNVEYSNWRNEIPRDAALGRCEERVRRTQDNPGPNTVEVCGTPYTMDTGTGIGAVVQDCVYEVYEDWCRYTIQEWIKVDEVRATENNRTPYWPELQLPAGQREGERTAEYVVYFDADGDDYTYTTNNLDTFMQLEVGSQWILEVNSFNAVVGILPAN